AQFRGQYNSEWHLLMAASMLVVAPVLVLFLVAQRHFVAGVALTGIKG
nr:carbohydrate ABC transporter permease [Chloroflexia bacterium]